MTSQLVFVWASISRFVWLCVWSGFMFRKVRTLHVNFSPIFTQITMHTNEQHTDRYGMVYNSNYLLFLNRYVAHDCKESALSGPNPPIYQLTSSH